MILSPFEVLAVDPGSPFSVIKASYKKLILTNHPDKSGDPETKKRFIEIQKAYEQIKSTPSPLVQRPRFEASPPPKTVQEYDIELKLEDLLSECIKSVPIDCKVYDSQGLYYEFKQTFRIVIPKGCNLKARFSFLNNGTVCPNEQSADIIFSLRLEPHKHFRLHGKNIIYNVAFEWPNGKFSDFLHIPLLEGGSYKLPVSRGRKRFKQKELPYKGLPINEILPQVRGKLIINIRFKNPIFCHELHLFLEEFHLGCVKSIDIISKNKDCSDETNHSKTTTFQTQIPPGLLPGHKIVIPLGSDNHPGTFPSDIMLVLRDFPHRNYIRLNDYDLLYTGPISSSVFNIPLIDGGFLPIDLSCIDSAKSIKLVGYGLFLWKSDHLKRGNLYVCFAPERLSSLEKSSKT